MSRARTRLPSPLSRLLRLGICPDAPAADVRTATFTNSVALVLMPFALLNAAQAAWFASWPMVWLQVIQAALAGVALFPSARGRHVAAAAWIGATAVGFVSLYALAFGGAVNVTVFYATICFVQFFLFPPRAKWLMWGVVALCVAAYGVTSALGGERLVDLGVSRGYAQFTAHHFVVSLLLLSTIFGLYSRNAIERTESALEAERQRSEALLLNTLPVPIAQRLKAGEPRIADHHDEVTILFSDLVGFTALSRALPANELVAMLDEVFSKMDAIATRLGLEKIKTIGDAYMVAAGIPTARPDHAEAIATMALEMRELMQSRLSNRYAGLDLRMGIHTGPVVAGVIGDQKLLYDLWGETVNTASRMETHGEPGRIQVSRAVHERLCDSFVLEPRGTIEVKGCGRMETWYLEGRRPAGEVRGRRG